MPAEKAKTIATNAFKTDEKLQARQGDHEDLTIPRAIAVERGEDALADSLADAWFTIDKAAAARGDNDERKAETTLLEWAAKLASIIRGER